MNLKIASKAMYGSWGFYSPIRALFDAGEGVASALGNYVYGVENIFISHGHSDHICSLPAFIGARAFARGEKTKPLTIYYPESRTMNLMREYISALHPKLPYDLTWQVIGPGFTLDYPNGLTVKAFATKHTYNSLGFVVLEKRSRLKPGILPEQAKELAAKGECITENYLANSFVWTLDSVNYDRTYIQNASWLVADTTFLKTADRDDYTHASVEEVLNWAVEANVKRLTLAHFSVRYNFAEISPFVLDKKAKIGFTGKLDIVLPNKIYEL